MNKQVTVLVSHTKLVLEKQAKSDSYDSYRLLKTWSCIILHKQLRYGSAILALSFLKSCALKLKPQKDYKVNIHIVYNCNVNRHNVYRHKCATIRFIKS